MYYDPIVMAYFATFIPMGLWALLLVWQWLSLPRVAGDVYDAHDAQGRLEHNVSREEYVRAYKSANAPRLSLYLLVAGLVSLILFPILVAFMMPAASPMYEFAATRGITPIMTVSADLAGGLLHFLLIMGVYAIILIATMFVYHKRRPAGLNAQLRRIEGAK